MTHGDTQNERSDEDRRVQMSSTAAKCVAAMANTVLVNRRSVGDGWQVCMAKVSDSAQGSQDAEDQTGWLNPMTVGHLET